MLPHLLRIETPESNSSRGTRRAGRGRGPSLTLGEGMKDAAQFLAGVVAAAATCAPTLIFAVWVSARFKRTVGISFRARVGAALLSVSLALLVCGALALASRYLERGSTSRLLVTLSTFSGYAYYLFVASCVSAFVVLAGIWSFSFARERRA